MCAFLYLPQFYSFLHKKWLKIPKTCLNEFFLSMKYIFTKKYFPCKIARKIAGETAEPGKTRRNKAKTRHNSKMYLNIFLSRILCAAGEQRRHCETSGTLNAAQHHREYSALKSGFNSWIF